MRKVPTVMPRSLPRSGWLLLLLWMVLVLSSIPTRSYIPIDETRYVTVAWNMWLRGDWLVPWLNGEAYHHKPPLLFWLINAGWWVSGVNDTWPRVLPALFSLLDAVLTYRLARLLWPERRATAELAPLVLMSALLWAVFTTATMFDILLAAFVLFGLHGLFLAGRDPAAARRGFVWLALALGGGLLAKGPVVFLHLLVPAALAPLWAPAWAGRWRGWYGRLLLAFLGGAAIVLAWAIPAALAGGEAFARAIFWGQTANRMVNAFAHKRSFAWYLPLLPLMLYPWFWLPQLWHGVTRMGWRQDAGLRFLALWLLTVFLSFCFISGKQMHYLLPLFPGVALLVARALTEDGLVRRGAGLLPALPLLALTVALLAGVRLPEPLAGAFASPVALAALGFIALALLSLEARHRLAPLVTTMHLAAGAVLLVAFFNISVMPQLMKSLDVRPIAQHLSRLEAQGIDLAFFEEDYPGIFDFVGRLKRPIAVFKERKEAPAWCAAHPEGRMIDIMPPKNVPADAEFVQDHFEKKLVVMAVPRAPHCRWH